MAKRLARSAKEHLTKARESCLAAVAAYNNPTAEFRTGTYIVLMIIAWTSLFHAISYKRRTKPWRVKSGSGRGTRYIRIGSDYRHWELGECLNQYYSGQWNAIWQNLKFLMGLRDRIEHRSMPPLDHEVFGECQACLLNFEELLEQEFGSEYALNTSLAFSLQFSGLLPAKRIEVMESLRRSAMDSVIQYVQTFRSELSLDIANDQRFAFKVFLVPQLANHRSKDTLSVEWLPIDQADDQTLKGLDRAIILVKQRQVAVRGNEYLPAQATRMVAEQIPWRFRPHEHVRSWKYFKVRPPAGATDPSNCDRRYCQWDPTFRQYVYTDGWVKLLVTEMIQPKRFEEIVGRTPVPKNAGVVEPRSPV
ncbi:MAG: DUF3644 domain-containing protein [Chloroflexi bacterium]|nr:DUF3644 domain-containing protein [Chloroflexota bacterium]